MRLASSFVTHTRVPRVMRKGPEWENHPRCAVSARVDSPFPQAKRIRPVLRLRVRGGAVHVRVSGGHAGRDRARPSAGERALVGKGWHMSGSVKWARQRRKGRISDSRPVFTALPCRPWTLCRIAVSCATFDTCLIKVW